MDDIVLLLLIITLPLIAQLFITASYNRNLKKKCSKGLTGYDTARRILDSNGLNDVLIIETQGNLTDHYDPRRKVIKLSKSIYGLDTIASVAVAAHECGHAIQDKEEYTFLKIRSFLVPIVSIMSRLSYVVIFLGFLLEIVNLVDLGIVCVGAGVLFQFVTLPVEINASRRALKQLEELDIVDSEEKSSARNVLFAAALTYVAAALAELLQLIRLLNITRRR